MPLPRFEMHLVDKAHVSEKQAHFYRRWVAQFYESLARKPDETFTGDEQDVWLRGLAAEHEDWQVKQAVQELLGHASVQTTMIYTHVAKKNILGVRSPLDAWCPAFSIRRGDERYELQFTMYNVQFLLGAAWRPALWRRRVNIRLCLLQKQVPSASVSCALCGLWWPSNAAAAAGAPLSTCKPAIVVQM